MQRNALLASVLVVGAFTWGTNFLLLTPLLRLIAIDFSVSDAAVGQLATLHAAAAGLTALAVAPLLDRYGRARALRWGTILLIVGTILTAGAPHFALLFPARAIAGIGAAFILSGCLAAAGDIFPDTRQRNRAMAAVIGATGLAPALGLPVLALIGGTAGWRLATISLLVPCVVLTFGSLTIPNVPSPTTSAFWGDYFGRFRVVLGNWETSWLFTTMILRSVVWYSGLIYLGAFAIEVFGLDARRLSLLLFALGASYFVATNLVAAVVNPDSVRRLFVLSTLSLSASFVLVGFFSHPWQLFLFCFLFSTFGAGLLVSESILLTDSLPSSRGTIMSLRESGTQLGTAIGASMTGALLAIFGSYSLAYLILGLLLPVALVAYALSLRGASVRVARETATPAE